MNERDVFEAISSFDESKLESEHTRKGLGGLFRGRKALTALALCLAALMACGTVFGIGSALGWIDLSTKKVQYPDGRETELYIFAHNLTGRVDPDDFSDELEATIDDPEANIPHKYVGGEYVPGESFDGRWFESRSEAIDFVGIEGIKSFEALGLEEDPSAYTSVNAGKTDGKISYAMIDTPYANPDSGVWGVIISEQIYSSAYSEDDLCGYYYADHWEASSVTAKSGARGVQFIDITPEQASNGEPGVYVVMVPDGPIVYQLMVFADPGSEENAEALITSWLGLL